MQFDVDFLFHPDTDLQHIAYLQQIFSFLRKEGLPGIYIIEMHATILLVSKISEKVCGRVQAWSEFERNSENK